MSEEEQLPYEISGRELVHEAAGLRVQILTLEPGEAVPWHYHSSVSDTFVGVEGTTVVETRAPRGRHELGPGEHCVVPPRTAHEVTPKGGRRCRFTVIQGIGPYDFVPVGATAQNKEGSKA